MPRSNMRDLSFRDVQPPQPASPRRDDVRQQPALPDTVEGREAYNNKIDWITSRLRLLDAEVIAFQELWNARALVEALHVAAMEDKHDIIARDAPGRGKPQVAVAVRKGRHGQRQIAEGAHWHSRHIYKHTRESLDHILVSEEFHDHSRKRRWSFREMEILNDHLNREEFEELVASDHGLVRACFDWNPMLKEVGAA